MSTTDPPARQPWVAVFDLDGTLTWRDSLQFFLRGYIRLHPARVFRLWRLPVALAAFVLRGRDRGELKSRVIRMVMGGDTRAAMDAWTAAFVADLKSRRRFRPAALAVIESHRQAGDHLVLLSASPDLYVPSIGTLLGFERTLCTELKWQGDRLNGELKTLNRHGEEKSRCLEWLRTQYPDRQLVAYGNSVSDLPHMRLAERALLVNGNAAARSQAAKLGIPTSDWS